MATISTFGASMAITGPVMAMSGSDPCHSSTEHANTITTCNEACNADLQRLLTRSIHKRLVKHQFRKRQQQKQQVKIQPAQKQYESKPEREKHMQD